MLAEAVARDEPDARNVFRTVIHQSGSEADMAAMNIGLFSFRSFFRFLGAITLGICLFLVAKSARAREDAPAELAGIGVDSVLGTQLPLGIPVVREDGNAVPLSSYFDGRHPVVLVLSYYRCPMLCGLLLNSVRVSLQRLGWSPGDHYRVVTISIDRNEGSDLAREKRRSIFAAADPTFRPPFAKNWAFLVGKDGSEKQIADAVGFHYKWDAKEKQWAHSAAIFFLSPDGKLTRVLYGLEFPPQDLKLALLEAGEGKVGSLTEKLQLFCFHYDPKTNKYAAWANRLVSLGGGLTVAALALAWAFWFLRSHREGRAGISEGFPNRSSELLLRSRPNR